MSMLRRTLSRETKPAPAPPPVDPAIAAALQRQIDDPSTGEIRRNQLRRRLDPRLRDGRAFGPSGPPAHRNNAPDFPPGPDDYDLVYIAHRKVVEAEIAEIDEHMRTVEARLSVLGSGSFEAQELHRERSQLRALRAELETEKPIRVDRDGRPLGKRLRAYIRARAREIRESKWAAAARAAAEGDHRRARQLRHDSLRSRHLSEHEMHLKSGGLRGYSFAG